jgi:hypothetical protein
MSFRLRSKHLWSEPYLTSRENHFISMVNQSVGSLVGKKEKQAQKAHQIVDI